MTSHGLVYTDPTGASPTQMGSMTSRGLVYTDLAGASPTQVGFSDMSLA